MSRGVLAFGVGKERHNPRFIHPCEAGASDGDTPPDAVPGTFFGRLIYVLFACRCMYLGKSFIGGCRNLENSLTSQLGGL